MSEEWERTAMEMKMVTAFFFVMASLLFINWTWHVREKAELAEIREHQRAEYIPATEKTFEKESIIRMTCEADRTHLSGLEHLPISVLTNDDAAKAGPPWRGSIYYSYDARFSAQKAWRMPVPSPHFRKPGNSDWWWECSEGLTPNIKQELSNPDVAPDCVVNTQGAGIEIR